MRIADRLLDMPLDGGFYRSGGRYILGWVEFAKHGRDIGSSGQSKDGSSVGYGGGREGGGGDNKENFDGVLGRCA